MKLEVKNVKDYWTAQSSNFQLDSEILSDCVSALTDAECAVLTTGDATDEAFVFLVNKVFNRHNDVCNGVTVISDGAVEISSESSITELEISLDTLINCNRNCIYHIADVNKEILPALTFEAIAELTAAIITCDAGASEE